MRGGIAAAPEDPLADPDAQNSIFYFGCKENGGVDEKSTLCISFFQELRKFANPANGSVRLPEALMLWTPGKDGTQIPNVCRQIRLTFDDFEIDPAAAEAMNSTEAQQIAKLQAQIAAMEETKGAGGGAAAATPPTATPAYVDNMSIMIAEKQRIAQIDAETAPIAEQAKHALRAKCHAVPGRAHNPAMVDCGNLGGLVPFNVKYKGQWKITCQPPTFDGFGEFLINNVAVYKGEVSNGKFNGGMCISRDHLGIQVGCPRFTDKYVGTGWCILPGSMGGGTYHGQFANDKFSGKGYFRSGLIDYKGEFVDSKCHGYAHSTLRWMGEVHHWEGTCRMGDWHGLGIYWSESNPSVRHYQIREKEMELQPVELNDSMVQQIKSG